MDILLNFDSLMALATLTLMEIVLGIDNIIFIAILTGRLPSHQQNKARNIGIVGALGVRILLLFSIQWIMSLEAELFSLFQHSFSTRDLILIAGGLFLIAKATVEIHHKTEGKEDNSTDHSSSTSPTYIIGQILVLDIVFSLDSVITAVGMVPQISIMVIAMSIAMLVMLASAKSIGGFVERHPSVKILALSFLILIGVVLVMEGMGGHMSKSYIYFAMFFSLVVELINMRYRSKNVGK